MSRYLDSLKVGDQVDFKGPVGWLKYYGEGTFGMIRSKDTPEEKNTYKNVGLVAGGTGMTPLYQVAKTISDEKNAPTNAKMVFSNHVSLLLYGHPATLWLDSNCNLTLLL